MMELLGILFWSFVIGVVLFIVGCLWASATMTPEQEEANRQYMKELEAKIAEEKAKGVYCPHCGSTQYTVMKRGWKMTTGFIGSSKPIRVCDKCLKKF